MQLLTRSAPPFARTSGVEAGSTREVASSRGISQTLAGELAIIICDRQYIAGRDYKYARKGQNIDANPEFKC